MKDFMNACLTVEGRWNRKKFWLYPLTFLIPIVLLILITVAGISIMWDAYKESTFNTILSLISFPYFLLIFYVSIAAYIKRFHDLNRSGWWILLMMIPIIGWGFQIYAAFFKGTQGPNRFGPDPLGGTAEIPKEKQETIEL